MVTSLKAGFAPALGAIAASAIFLSAPASAQTAPIVVSTAPPAYLNIQRVGYADLNLATYSGQRMLLHRVSRAVDRVCLYAPGERFALAEPDFNTCTWGAWKRAEPQMANAVFRARQLAYYRGY